MKIGDTVYLVCSNRYIKEAILLKITGEFALNKFTGSGGGITIRKNRLHETEEEALKAMGMGRRIKKLKSLDYLN